jgi:hypothetical protein
MKMFHKGIIIIGISVIIFMLMFPPFHVIYSPGIEIHKGYAFILNPPIFWDHVESTVDMNLLLLQIIAVVILVGSFRVFFKMYNK